MYPQAEVRLLSFFILGIEIIIGTRILKGEAEVEVGGGMTVIGTVEETKITVTGTEAAARIIKKLVEGVNMMKRGAAEVGLMEGRFFLLISLFPRKSHLISFV